MPKKKICCIYKIINVKNNKYYIGSTENYESRIKRHQRELIRKNHHCIHLQRAYDKGRKEDFIYKIIEICEPINRVKLEQSYLDKINFSECYNVSKTASGGDMISNHPNRDEIIRKATNRLLEENKKIANIERNKSLIGDKNPNFGNKWDDKQRKRASKMMKKRMENLPPEEKLRLSKLNSKIQREFWDGENGLEKRKELSKTMKGEGNHFYGKKHSKESLKKISDKNKGKTNENCWIKVVIDNVVYKSLSEASKILDISTSNLINRLKSTNPKFINWNYFGKIKKCKDLKSPNAVKYKVKDKIYSSLSAACKDLNLSSSALTFRAKSTNPKWDDYSFIREDSDGNKDLTK